MKKYCSYHKCMHDVSEFGKNKSRSDGLHRYCRAARSELGKKNRVKSIGIKTSESRVLSKSARDFLHYSEYWGGSISSSLPINYYRNIYGGSRKGKDLYMLNGGERSE